MSSNHDTQPLPDVEARLKRWPTASGVYAAVFCGYCGQELTALLWETGSFWITDENGDRWLMNSGVRAQVLGHEQGEGGIWRLAAYAARRRRAAWLSASQGEATPEDRLRLRHNRWARPGDRSTDGMTTNLPEGPYPPNSFAAREAGLPSRFATVHWGVRWHCPKCERVNHIMVPAT